MMARNFMSELTYLLNKEQLSVACNRVVWSVGILVSKAAAGRGIGELPHDFHKGRHE